MPDFKLLIGGRLVDGASTMDVINPATEEVLAACPRASERQLNEAVAAAKAAFPGWAATPIDVRRASLVKIADIIDAHREELARLLTQEQGKPLKNARGDAGAASDYFRYFATFDLPVEVIEDNDERRVEAHRKPLGVVAAIIPWNFPLALFGHKAPAALIAGNTLVVKPSPTTPLSTLRLGELIKDVLPPGVLNIITDQNDLGPLLGAHPDISKLSFTGSSATGRKVMASAAGTIKRLTLELGGNDAAIALDDVDPKATAQKLFDGAFGNTGQVCIAIKRLYVHESIYDEMCDELVALADKAVVGDGLQQGTEYGPLQNKMQFEKVKAYLADAHANGKVLSGGVALDQPGYFIRPTIVRDIAEGTRLVDEEQFGPVLPVIKFSDDEDALSRANDSELGLGGSIWSSNPGRAYALADRMEAGTVWVNQHAQVGSGVPFGGAKQSGLGSELSREGLFEYTQLKIVNIAR